MNMNLNLTTADLLTTRAVTLTPLASYDLAHLRGGPFLWLNSLSTGNKAWMPVWEPHYQRSNVAVASPVGTFTVGAPS